jgi:hypothetical protein
MRDVRICMDERGDARREGGEEMQDVQAPTKRKHAWESEEM